VTHAFVQEATATGIDIYRIFDALNNVESMRPAIDAVRETGTAVAEVAMSYTGDLSDPNENLYTLDYYLKLAEQIVDAGAHVLAINTTQRPRCTKPPFRGQAIVVDNRTAEDIIELGQCVGAVGAFVEGRTRRASLGGLRSKCSRLRRRFGRDATGPAKGRRL
jgi:hypothetical protein